MRAIPWNRVFARSQNTVANVSQFPVFGWTLPQHVVFLTFRVVIDNFILGAVTISLRFGFTDDDISPTLGQRQRINFPSLGPPTGNATTASFAPGATLGPANDFVGNYNAVAAPRVGVFLSTGTLVGFRGTWGLYYSGIVAS